MCLDEGLAGRLAVPDHAVVTLGLGIRARAAYSLPCVPAQTKSELGTERGNSILFVQEKQSTRYTNIIDPDDLEERLAKHNQSCPQGG